MMSSFYSEASGDFRYRVGRIVDLLLFMSIVFQVALYPTVLGVLVCLELALGWLMIKHLALFGDSFTESIISSSMVVLFGLFGCVLPITLTTLEGTPVTNNLRLPLLTGAAQFILASLYCAALFISRGPLGSIRNGLRLVGDRFLLYRPLPSRAVWVLGVSGLLANYYIYFVLGYWSMDVGGRGIDYVIANIFAPFAWLPVILFFPALYIGGLEESLSRTRGLAVGYCVVVSLFAIGTNWRTLVFSGGIYFGCTLFFICISGLIDWRAIFSAKRVLGAILVGALFGPVLSDVGVAMLIVRSERTDVSFVDLIARTLDVALNRDSLDRYKEDMMRTAKRALPIYEWDESYLENPVLGRFVSLKIADNCLYYAMELEGQREMMREDLANQVIAFSPAIVSALFGLTGDDRDFVKMHSPGDLLISTYLGRAPEMGAQLISHPIGMGLAYFGWAAPAVIVIMMVFVFLLVDLLYNIEAGGNIRVGLAFASMFGACLIMLTDRHVFLGEYKFVFRGFGEGCMLAVFLTWFFARSKSNNYLSH